MWKLISIFATIVFALLFFQACNSNPDVILNEINVEQVTFDEVIHMNNCGGTADSEQTVTRSFTTNLDVGAEISAGYHGLIEGRLSAMYGQQREIAKSIRLIAPPGTDMQFLLRWLENAHSGSVKIDGRYGEYTVSIPIGVEQVESNDLRCNTPELVQIEDFTPTPSPALEGDLTPTMTITPAPMQTINISKPTRQEFANLTNIWDLINYDNPTTPSTLIYNVPIEADKTYRWGAIWCGINADNLTEILAPLTMNLVVNDELLGEDEILEFIEIRNGWHCQRWVTKLSRWQPGTTTRLELIYSLSEPIFDGVEITEAGEYHLIIDAQAN